MGVCGAIAASAGASALLRRFLGLSRKSPSNRASGYYGLRHLVLNLGIPTTSWLNFGYWKEIDLNSGIPNCFVHACEELARLVANRANLSKNDAILGACGCACVKV